MKRIGYISYMFMATLLVAGCMDEIDGGTDRPVQTDSIIFSASLEDMNNSPMTRAVGDYTIMELSDWDGTSGIETKASVMETLPEYASIYAYQYADKFDPTDYTRLLDNAKFQFEGDGTLEPVGNLTYWANLDKSKKAFFCSYAPYYEGDGTNPIQPTVYPMDATGNPGVTYTVPTDVKDQTDVLYAWAEVAGDYKRAIPFEYRHALTAIQFKMGFACKVKSISIQNVNTRGTFTFAKATSDNVWEESNTLGDYTVSFGDGVAKSAGEALTDGENTMMLIPQTFADDAAAKVVLVYDDGGTDKTISASLAGSAWGMGKRIVYTLYNEKQSLDYVIFDLAAGSVTIGANSYSGKVYVDGTATDVTASGLTSEQIAGTKFYIYQSSGKEGDYDKDNTGYSSEADMNYPEKCRIPQYDEVTCNGKPWRDYITNNEDLRSIIANWKTGADAVGRTSTANNVTISGSSTYNITLDNIWTVYYANKTANIAITAKGLQNTATGDIIISKNSGGKVNLGLKGDNRLYHIYYDNNYTDINKSYLKFTSNDGDGSHSGTLTAAPERPVDRLGEGVTIIGPEDGGDASYNFIFAGGTIFASDPLMYSNSEENGGVEGVMPNDNYVTGTIGGGGNGDASVYINGGTLTALGHSTGPAIGGGGGHEARGGAGTVEITGGKVYAYTYGVWSGKFSKFVPMTTIGGGGSVKAAGASGSVKITGGYVYAQSRGGSALGGSCSPSNNGGNGTIEITDGIVIAKSTAGECYQTNGTDKAEIVPGTAIGGGNGTTGGTATVTISGGTVRTGSVGGGKPVEGNAIGNATVKISGGDILAQFIMAKTSGARVNPTFTMTGGTISNSSTTDDEYLKAIDPTSGNVYEGGAVHMEQGTCTISGGTIERCSSTLGGAIYMNGGEFKMDGGTLSHNHSASHGGAVYVSGGNVTVTGGTMTKNRTTNGHGGAVYVTGGSFSMPSGSTGIMTYNSANATSATSGGGNGGAVYVASTDNNVIAEIIAGTVTDNTADLNGGGMCVDMRGGEMTATVTMGEDGGGKLSPYINNNSASYSGGALCVLGANSNVTINSGTIRGNVSAYQKNQDIRNDGGTVTLTSDDCDIDYKTVTFHSNNGSDETTVQRIVTNTNSHLAVPTEATAWTYEFHTFDHWNTSKYGTGTTYTDGQTMNISSDIQLYAIWKENTVSE